MSGADLRAEHFLARTRRHWLHVECSQLFVGLLHRIGVDARRRLHSARSSAALCEPGVAAPAASRRGGRRVVDVLDALRQTAVATETCFDPVNRSAVPIGPLTAIAELP